MEHDRVLEGRVVTSSGIQDLEVGVTDGLIAALGHGLRGARRISAGRCLIFPGFVDIHVHLREPGWEYKEDFRTGSLAAIHGGVTTVADMPNNPAPATTRAALEAKKRLAEKALVGVELYAGVTAAGLGRIGEVKGVAVGCKLYLSETTGSAAFPEADLPRAFEAVAGADMPLSIHCEDQGVIDRKRRELAGELRPDLHCDLRPPEAEEAAVRKVVSAMRRSPGARINICHASTAHTLSVVRSARAEGLNLSCEATLHHLYFNRNAILESGMLRTNPPLRSDEDRVALLEGLKDRAVSFLVSDHAPHTEEEKSEKGAAGVPGLDDYAHLVSWLIRAQGVDPLSVARLASTNPSEFLGLEDRGEIAIGRRADFTVLDVHSPEKVRNEDVRSKCGWSPYEGKEFPGRARWTIVGGEPLLDDFEPVR